MQEPEGTTDLGALNSTGRGWRRGRHAFQEPEAALGVSVSDPAPRGMPRHPTHSEPFLVFVSVMEQDQQHHHCI